MLRTLRTNQYPARCSVCRCDFGAAEGYYDIIAGQRRFFCGKHAPPDGDVGAPDDDDEPPAPTPAQPAPLDDAALDAAVTKISELSGEWALSHMPTMLDKLLPAMVAAEVVKATRTVEIKLGTAPKIKMENTHRLLPTILTAVSAGVHPFLVGPAGSGKTTLAEQIAKALKRKFYMAARVTSEFKLTGFKDAQGQTVRTQFREAFEHGGVFLFDEVDASDPDALTAFNAALSNGMGDFPDGMVRAHKDFVAIAAGNTYGRGADRQYVGRNQLDAATLDRFTVFDVDYDEQLELGLSGNPDWARYVQSVRRAVEHEKVRHVVSPRATISGAKLLAAGMDRVTVEQATIWKGLPIDARSRVEARMAAQGNSFTAVRG